MDTVTGWRWFAGIVLALAGIMRFFDSLWAFNHDGALPDNFEGALFGHTLTTYGWVYLIVAIILVGSAIGVVRGSQFSRWLGVFAGGVLAISATWWLPFYPVWALTYILIGALVVYGLAMYGDASPAKASAPDPRSP